MDKLFFAHSPLQRVHFFDHREIAQDFAQTCATWVLENFDREVWSSYSNLIFYGEVLGRAQLVKTNMVTLDGRDCSEIAVKDLADETDIFCEWESDRDGEFYETDCGEAHTFFEGNIEQNNHRFCPYCGRKTKEKQGGL